MSRVRCLVFRLFHLGLCLTAIGGCASVESNQGRYAAAATLRSPANLPATALFNPISTVVVDAGHGGHDPGTQHFGLVEKNLALDISRRLKAQLEAQGLTGVMTRETDQFIPLPQRPGIANRLSADLFVSVHINANKNSGVSGAEVYYPRESLVSAAAPWPPGVASAEIGFPSNTIKQVLWDLVLTRSRSQSRRLASSICGSLRASLGVSCRGPKSARFVVLKESWMPAVLVEVGYVSNQAEAQRLSNVEYRQAAALAIAEGVTAYIRDRGVQHI